MIKSSGFFIAVSLLYSAFAFPQQTAPAAGNAAQSQAEPAPSGKAPALAERPATRPEAAAGRIQLDVVVADKSGKPVSGLDLKDFSLLDNNQPVKILSFQAHDGAHPSSDLPVEVILLIDTVNLDFRYVAFVRQQMESFLTRNGGHLAQPVSLFVLTNTGLDIAGEPTTDGNALAEKVKQFDYRLRTIGPAQGVDGSIERFYSSLRSLSTLLQDEASRPGKKLLIWAGPGWPMLDSVNVQVSASGQRQNFESIVGLSTALREQRISLYSISSAESGVGATVYRDFLKGVKSAAKVTPPNLGLKVLAVQSGGRVLGPNNQLTSQIDNCFSDATSFYTLSFDPPHADHADEYHDLKVLIGEPGLVARTNTGYYNQP